MKNFLNFLGKEVTEDLSDLKEVLTDPLFDGIEWIIVSLGGDGAFAKHQNTFYKVDIPKIEVVNPVGSEILRLQEFHQLSIVKK